MDQVVVAVRKFSVTTEDIAAKKWKKIPLGQSVETQAIGAELAQRRKSAGLSKTRLKR